MVKKVKKEFNLWTAEENGKEKTNSSKIIKQSLSTLKQKGRFIVLMQKNYQSGSAILVDFNDQFLTLDKPIDWPGKSKRIRVVFKDEAMVWNYFTAFVVGEGKDTIKTKFPQELFRIQRRSHFRIDMPAGTSALFRTKDASYNNITVGNLSIGGMMFCLADKEFPEGLKDQTEIHDIIINISPQTGQIVSSIDADQEHGECVAIAAGIIVRSFSDEDSGNYCLGAKFILNGPEEEKLLKLVRQRELELLRKGLLD